MTLGNMSFKQNANSQTHIGVLTVFLFFFYCAFSSSLKETH